MDGFEMGFAWACRDMYFVRQILAHLMACSITCFAFED